MNFFEGWRKQKPMDSASQDEWADWYRLERIVDHLEAANPHLYAALEESGGSNWNLNMTFDYKKK